jgi:hypothetical protein
MDDLLAAQAALESQAANGDDDADADADEAIRAASIRAGVSVMRRFYAAFFEEVYGAEVDGFGWESKREAVEAILNNADEEESPVAAARLDVASLFEDLSDVLHGDLDFGYTDDFGALRAFADEYLPVWEDVVFDWLDKANREAAASLRAEYELRRRH